MCVVRCALIGALLSGAGCTVSLPPLTDAAVSDAASTDRGSAEVGAADVALADQGADACVSETAPEARFSAEALSCTAPLLRVDGTGSLPGGCGQQVQRLRWRLLEGDAAGPVLLELEGAAGDAVQQPGGGGTYERPQLRLVDPQLVDGARVGRFEIVTAGTTQLLQHGFVIEEGVEYELSFAASCNTGHDLSLIVREHADPFTELGLNQAVDLRSDWRRFTFVLVASGGAADARLQFLFSGKGKAGDVYWFDNAVLRRTDGTGPANMLGNPGFEDAALAPWSNNPPGDTKLAATPVYAALPTRYVLELTVTDDAGQSSAPLVETIDAPSCP